MNVNINRHISYNDYTADIECDTGDWKPYIKRRRYNRRKYNKRFIKNNTVLKPIAKISKADINSIKLLLDKQSIQKTIPFYFQRFTPVAPRQNTIRRENLIWDDNISSLISKLQLQS